MDENERDIRQLVSTWLDATKKGDVETQLSLLADDMVFLLPGMVMRKSDFERGARAQAGPDGPQIDGQCDIQELTILGDWAFMWTNLRVTITPKGGEPNTRAGHTLTILKKQNGKWVLARDANLLTPVEND